MRSAYVVACVAALIEFQTAVQVVRSITSVTEASRCRRVRGVLTQAGNVAGRCVRSGAVTTTACLPQPLVTAAPAPPCHLLEGGPFFFFLLFCIIF